MHASPTYISLTVLCYHAALISFTTPSPFILLLLDSPTSVVLVPSSPNTCFFSPMPHLLVLLAFTLNLVGALSAVHLFFCRLVYLFLMRSFSQCMSIYRSASLGIFLHVLVISVPPPLCLCAHLARSLSPFSAHECMCLCV